MREPVRFATALMLLLAPMVLSACGGGGGPVAIQDVCTEMRDEICKFFDRCDYAWALQMAQHQTCQEMFVCDPQEMADMQQSVDEGRMAYDQGTARKCLNQLAQASCTDLQDVFGDLGDDCEKVFSGLVPAGADCYYEDECVDGHFCDESAEQCPGQCQPCQQIGEECNYADLRCDYDTADCSWQEGVCVELGDLGDACDEISCKEGLDCDWDASLEVCFRPGLEGDGCETEDHCSGMLYCQDGTCTGPAAQGQPCNLDEFDNFALVCEAGSYCDADIAANQWDGTCQPKKNSGLECIIYFECASGLLCIGAEINEGTSVIIKGTCGQPLQENQDCGAPVGLPECDYDLYCEGVCRAFPGIGDSCVYGEDPECLGQDIYCSTLEQGQSGTCLARKPEGESCTDYEECQSYNCSNGVCQPDDDCRP